MVDKNHELVKLAVDLYKGNYTKFSKEDLNETLRQELIKLNDGNEKFNRRAFRRNKPEIFEIIEVALDQLIVNVIDQQFNDFIDVRNLALGDTNVFNLPNTDLFQVAMVANGTSNLDRQRLGDKGQLTVTTFPYGIKIYEELNRLLAGKIDWTDLVNRVAKSFELKLATDIYNAIYSSYTSLSATYGITGNFVDSTMTDLIQHVEAATGQNCWIFGTKSALSRIDVPKIDTEKAKDAFNTLGYYGSYKGNPMREIKQFHTWGTDTFAINDKFVMIVPVGDLKIVKLVYEGESFIEEFNNLQGDQSREYLFTINYGLNVITSAKYGIYRFA